MSGQEQIDPRVSRSDLVHDRLRESPAKRWFLLDGNRYLLATILSLGVFGTCAMLGLAGIIPIDETGPTTTLVSAIVGGTLPFITIVLAINQLVLSQELDWPGELTERFDKMAQHRREVESLTDTAVSPAAPADFLSLVVRAVVECTDPLDRIASDHDDHHISVILDGFTDAVRSEGTLVTESLEDADFGTFEALSAVLGHFNGAHLYAARRIRAHHGDALSEEAIRSLDQLIELLAQLAVARQTFKTLYMQHELSHLSKLLLVVGFPALLGGGLFMMSYGEIVTVVDSRVTLIVVVSTVVTVVFLPFTILLVYTFRIASIAERTADFGPFVPRVAFDTGHDENSERNRG